MRQELWILPRITESGNATTEPLIAPELATQSSVLPLRNVGAKELDTQVATNLLHSGLPLSTEGRIAVCIR